MKHGDGSHVSYLGVLKGVVMPELWQICEKVGIIPNTVGIIPEIVGINSRKVGIIVQLVGIIVRVMVNLKKHA
jgi:hypothetical protein